VHASATPRWLALAALIGLIGCQRCAASTPSPDAAPPATVASVAPGAAPAPPSSASPDIPEIRDTGAGRATAALRAVLAAYGIAYDTATLDRECKVDDDGGASIDDLEDVADKYGLEAPQVIVPAEHVLLSEPTMFPAIVVVDGSDDGQDFVVAWRLDGDRVEIMSPVEGRTWIPRAELEKRLHVHEQAMPADSLRAAMGSQPFRDALRARMEALGTPRAAAQALVDRAAADPGIGGLAALDASIRRERSTTAPGPGDIAARLAASFGCAFESHCDGVAPIPAELWWAQPAPNGPDGASQANVKGAVLLAIAGRKAPVASDAGGG